MSRESLYKDGQGNSVDEAQWRSSSSTMMLVEEAFLHHDTESPETAETSALGYSQNPRNRYLGTHSQQPDRGTTTQPCRDSGLSKVSRLIVTELVSLLPNQEVITILVNNYFDKIHWFMLLFHQREFRAALHKLYAGSHPAAQEIGQRGGIGVGYVSVLLATCALSLRYLSTTQQSHLAECGSDMDNLRERILTALRLRLLDILGLGSLEAVQTCVLLGSYYLYHGEPELAWPLCGCALRLSQALELHRRPARHTGINTSQENIEARKRCWWAVHEIETFCSMIYGFPLSISGIDCDAEPLDPRDPWSIAADEQPSPSDRPSLLVYKCSMSDLSSIVQSVIQDLYSSRQDLNRQAVGSTATSETSVRLQDLVRKVRLLDTQLAQWYSALPDQLKLGNLSEDCPEIPADDYHSEDQEQDRLSSSFISHLFRLQALALKLAFENARILLHRPLMSCKVAHSFKSLDEPTTSRQDSYRASLQVCRDAALQISYAGHTPVFKEASATYAMNFIYLHFLTAGVTLCITASLNPLSRESFESKLAVRRLMKMQAQLRLDSIVAHQGLEILKKLSVLLMKKETETMLALESREDDPAPSIVKGHSGGGPSISLDQPLDKEDEQPANDSQVPSNVATEEGDDWSWGFNDALMTQTMLDVEQVLGASACGSPTQFPDIMEDGASFISFDQSWMWGPTVDFP